jgi:hypothetical protein
MLAARSLDTEQVTMLTGAVIGAAIVLLVVLSEGFSGFLWQDSDAQPRFYCPTCDLRYTKFEVSGLTRVCPYRHATTVPDGFNWKTALVTACATFIVSGIVMVSAGVVR